MILAALAMGMLLAPPPPVVVRATAARVRKAPSESAEIVARLRIHTYVEVRAGKDGWSQIRAEGAEGWVRSELVGPPLSDQEITAGLQAAAPVERLLWAERRAAANPDDPESWRFIAELHEQHGSAADAKANRARADGAANLYFARCHGGDAVLLAGIVDGKLQRFDKVIGDGEAPDAAVGALRAIGDFIGLEAWRLVGGGAPPGTPFPAPRVVVVEDYLQKHARLHLGKCPAGSPDGAVLTTALIEALRTTGAFDPKKATQLADTARKAEEHLAAVVGVELQKVEAASPLVWVRVTFDHQDAITELWGERSVILFTDPKLRVQQPSPPSFVEVQSPRWYRWSRAGKEAVLGIATVRDSAGSWSGVGNLFLPSLDGTPQEPVTAWADQGGPGC